MIYRVFGIRQRRALLLIGVQGSCYRAWLSVYNNTSMMISNQALMRILLALNLKVHVLLLLWRVRIKGTHGLFHVTFIGGILVACRGWLKLITCPGFTVVKRIRLHILLASFHGRWDWTVACTIGLRINWLSRLILHLNLIQMQLIVVVRATHAIRIRIYSVLVIIRLIHILIGLTYGSASDSRHVVP